MRTLTLDEYADLAEHESSEERLEKLSPEHRSPRLFSQRATELQSSAHLEVRVESDARQLPVLGLGREFHYDYCSYAHCLARQQAGESLLVSLAFKEGQVVGYAIAALQADGSREIEILDVAKSYRRASGLKLDLIVQDETFSVGVAHVVVVELLRTFHGELTVVARESPSRYVFKSLGFAELPGDSCRLHKLPEALDQHSPQGVPA